MFLPENLPFSLDLLPANSYLVGGAVRDALLDRTREYLDLDFVLPTEAVETAKKIAQYYRAGFVVLDRERQIARVVFKQGTVDFAQQEGESLVKDLQRRDFTVNAIAYDPQTKKLIDPLGGLADLEKRVLRMVSPANLEDDPLRLLRAYRQAAQLNFSLDCETRATIRTLAPKLRSIAAERVQNELGYLLRNPRGSKWLAAAWQDGLLQPWFAHLTAKKLERVAKIDSLGQYLAKTWLEFGTNANSWNYLAKLAILFSAIPDKAELELLRLKYSRAEIRAVTSTLKHLPEVRCGCLTLREQYFFFLDLGNILPILALSALAVDIPEAVIFPLIDRYFNSEDKVAHPQPLVTGHDLIKALHLSPSPQIKTLLTEIQVASIEGKISTPSEALQFAAKLMVDKNDKCKQADNEQRI